MDGEEEWVVIGGKGRPRRTPQQQEKHMKARAAVAEALAAIAHSSSPLQQQQQQQHIHHLHHHLKQQQQHVHEQPRSSTDLQPNSPNQPAAATAHQQQQLDAIAAAVAAASPPANQPLPGWGPPPDREWKVASSSKAKKKKGRQQLPSTPEEQAQHVMLQVQDISRQLAQAPVYAALLAAMQQAAAGVQAAEAGPSQLCDTQQQQGGQCDGSSSSNSSSSCCSWGWSSVQQLVVYGLGSVEDSKVSQHQLALVLLLQQLLPGLQQPPQLYDPAFSEVDVMLLQQMGLQVIGVNEEGRRSVAAPTLFYLPHCEGVLCDNLLDANWGAAALSSMAILGNSFATYQVRWSGPEGSRPKTRRPDKLLQLVEQGAVLEVPVPDQGYHVASAFNDMSLHTFRPASALFEGCR